MSTTVSACAPTGRGYRMKTELQTCFSIALSIINKSGGVAVLAHPGQIYRKIEVENILRELKCFGLKGIEIYHPSHSQSDINKFFNLARKYKLSITGGSDYHGKQIGYENLSIGSYGLNQEYLEKFIKSNNK